jgi:hypothetical protein
MREVPYPFELHLMLSWGVGDKDPGTVNREIDLDAVDGCGDSGNGDDDNEYHHY